MRRNFSLNTESTKEHKRHREELARMKREDTDDNLDVFFVSFMFILANSSLCLLRSFVLSVFNFRRVR